jgi:gliding motility-associated-like protein
VATNLKGCSDTATKIIHVQPLPAPNVGLDTTLCLGQSVQLNATGANQYQWTPAAGLSCTTCASPVANPTVSTQYSLLGTTAFGCTAFDSIWVYVIQPSTVLAPPDDSLCYSQGISLTATGTQVYTWTPATGLSNTGVPNPVARPTSSITYTVTGSDYKGCFVTSDTVRVTVFPIPQVDIGHDTTISVGASLPIVANVSPDVRDIRWEPTTSLSCLDCLDPVARPSTSITYTAVVTNDGGCTTTDEIHITVVCNNANIYMPNTFSPNGDGMNDVYYPRGHGIQAIKALRIFNRWGQIMYERQNFQANDASAAWDGRFHGTALPPDVYVYIMDYVCENGVIVSQKGDITLIR